MSSQFFRLYTSPDGETHFEDIEQSTFDVSEMRFFTSAAGTFRDLHTSRRRQFVLVHSGEADLIASDGEVRHMVPGSTMLAEDVTGKGHQMRVLGTEPCVWMFVALQEKD